MDVPICLEASTREANQTFCPVVIFFKINGTRLAAFVGVFLGGMFLPLIVHPLQVLGKLFVIIPHTVLLKESNILQNS